MRSTARCWDFRRTNSLAPARTANSFSPGSNRNGETVSANRRLTHSARAWKSSWKGPDGLGGECDALCLGKTGLFVGGSVITTAGGDDAAALKYVR